MNKIVDILDRYVRYRNQRSPEHINKYQLGPAYLGVNSYIYKARLVDIVKNEYCDIVWSGFDNNKSNTWDIAISLIDNAIRELERRPNRFGYLDEEEDLPDCIEEDSACA